MAKNDSIRQGDGPKPPNPDNPPATLPGGDHTIRQQLHKMGIDVSGYTNKQLEKFWGEIPDEVKNAQLGGDQFALQDIQGFFAPDPQGLNPALATRMRLENFNKYYTPAPWLLGPEATGMERYQARTHALFDITEYTPESAAALLNNPAMGRVAAGLDEAQIQQLRDLAGELAPAGSVYHPYTMSGGGFGGGPGVASGGNSPQAPTYSFNPAPPQYDPYAHATQTAYSLANAYHTALMAGDQPAAKAAHASLQAHASFMQDFMGLGGKQELAQDSSATPSSFVDNQPFGRDELR